VIKIKFVLCRIVIYQIDVTGVCTKNIDVTGLFISHDFD
jgi:hypothetical protein